MKEPYKIIKFNNNNLEIDVKISPFENTIWLSIDQIALLFERDKSVISRHIKNIFQINELDENNCVAFFATELNKFDPRTGKIRKTKVDIKFFNLDVIISVGYRVNSVMGVIFRKWANNILKEYLIKGYAINEERSLVTNENYIRLCNKVESLDERVSHIEDVYQPTKFKNSQIFFEGQFYDAYTLIQSLFELANNEIIIIDNYVDRTILDRLVVKKNNVQVKIFTSLNSRLHERDINVFNSQYGGLYVRYVANVHDRYIIIDQNKLYHLGYSIKDLGKKIFSISESDNNLIPVLLSNI